MIVSIVSKKGGVGKTTTAVSVGAALAAQGRRVLLVDVDPQASASLWLGVPRSELAPSVADVLLGRAGVAETIRQTRTQRLDLLTSSADLLHCERQLTSLREPDVVLRQRLRPVVEDRYDYVLLDAPAGLSLLTMNALVASDAFLVPATPDFLALEGLDNLLQATERIAFRNRVHLPCLGILLTKVDDRTRLSKETAARIRELHGHRVFSTEIHGNVRIAEAPAYGRTIFEYDDRSRSASDYRLLAVEIDLRRQRHETSRAAARPSPAVSAATAAAELAAPAGAASVTGGRPQPRTDLASAEPSPNAAAPLSEPRRSPSTRPPAATESASARAAIPRPASPSHQASGPATANPAAADPLRRASRSAAQPQPSADPQSAAQPQSSTTPQSSAQPQPSETAQSTASPPTSATRRSSGTPESTATPLDAPAEPASGHPPPVESTGAAPSVAGPRSRGDVPDDDDEPRRSPRPIWLRGLGGLAG